MEERVEQCITDIKSGKPAEQKKGAFALWGLLSEPGVDKAAIVELVLEEHFIETIKDLMSSLTDARDVCAALLGALAYTRDAQLLLASHGVIPPLVSLVATGSHSEKKHAVMTLWHLASPDENKTLIVRHNALPHFVQILSDTHVPAQVHENVAGALMRLAVHAECRKQMVEVGAVPVLLHCLQSSHEQLVYFAAGALANLAVSDDCQAAIVRGGGVERALTAMRLGKSSVQETTAFMLLSLSAVPEYQKEIVQAGGLTVLLGLLDSDSAQAVDSAMAVLSNLSFLECVRPLLVRADATALLVKLLASHSDDDCSVKPSKEALRDAAVCLWNIAGGPELRESVLDAGGVEALLDIIDETTGEVQEAAVGALLALIPSPQLQERMLNVDAVPALVAVLRDGTDSAKAYSCGILLSLCKAHSAVVDHALAEEEAVEALVTCLRVGTEQQENALQLLLTLSEGSGGVFCTPTVKAIVNLCASRYVAPAVRETAADTLGSLALVGDFHINRIVEAGGVAAMASLFDHGENAECENAVWVLHLLSFSQDALLEMAQLDMFDDLETVLEVGSERNDTFLWSLLLSATVMNVRRSCSSTPEMAEWASLILRHVKKAVEDVGIDALFSEQWQADDIARFVWLVKSEESAVAAVGVLCLANACRDDAFMEVHKKLLLETEAFLQLKYLIERCAHVPYIAALARQVLTVFHLGHNAHSPPRAQPNAAFAAHAALYSPFASAIATTTSRTVAPSTSQRGSPMGSPMGSPSTMNNTNAITSPADTAAGPAKYTPNHASSRSAASSSATHSSFRQTTTASTTNSHTASHSTSVSALSTEARSLAPSPAAAREEGSVAYYTPATTPADKSDARASVGLRYTAPSQRNGGGSGLSPDTQTVDLRSHVSVAAMPLTTDDESDASSARPNGHRRRRRPSSAGQLHVAPTAQKRASVYCDSDSEGGLVLKRHAPSAESAALVSSTKDVLRLLDEWGFAQYKTVFRTQGVNGRLLLCLTDEMLFKDFGIESPFHRMKFLTKVEDLRRKHALPTLSTSVSGTKATNGSSSAAASSSTGSWFSFWKAFTGLPEQVLKQQLTDAVRAGAQQIGKSIPAEFLDPVTKTLMTDPVRTQAGGTYDRATISAWFEHHATDPMSGNKLNSLDLKPHKALQTRITKFRASLDVPTVSEEPSVSAKSDESGPSAPKAKGGSKKKAAPKRKSNSQPTATKRKR